MTPPETPRADLPWVTDLAALDQLTLGELKRLALIATQKGTIPANADRKRLKEEILIRLAELEKLLWACAAQEPAAGEDPFLQELAKILRETEIAVSRGCLAKPK